MKKVIDLKGCLIKKGRYFYAKFRIDGKQENNIENPVEIQKFDRLGYSFRSDLSSDSEYVFERKKIMRIITIVIDNRIMVV